MERYHHMVELSSGDYFAFDQQSAHIPEEDEADMKVSLPVMPVKFIEWLSTAQVGIYPVTRSPQSFFL